MKQSIKYQLGVFLMLAAALTMLSVAGHAGAEWVPVKGVFFNTNISLKENLSALQGKTVEVTLTSGATMAGTVERVGTASLHLSKVRVSKVRGREAYDALVPLEKITAVQVRFRTLERK